MDREHGDLPHGLIPSTFTAPIAASLLRTTQEALASITRTGAIFAQPGARPTYARGELERILGRAIMLEEWQAAEERHEPRREANRKYNRKRWGRGRGGPSQPPTAPAARRAPVRVPPVVGSKQPGPHALLPGRPVPSHKTPAGSAP
jgi:hypothetical protein